MQHYELSFNQVAKNYGVSLEELVSQGVITEREAHFMRDGDSHATRFSTLEALCEAIGCNPSEFFVIPDEQFPESSSPL